MSERHKDSGLEMYAEGIASADAPVAMWLKVSYVVWIVVGIVGFALYWNGSWGWLDRGYWEELQRAADTTYPFRQIEPTPER